MFDREQYMKYVGSKSGSSYASGLVRIEKIYAVSIDESCAGCQGTKTAK